MTPAEWIALAALVLNSLLIPLALTLTRIEQRLSVLAAQFEAHCKSDDDNHEAVRGDLRELRERVN